MIRKVLLSILAATACLPLAWCDQQLHERPQYQLHVGDVLDLNYRLTPEFNQTVTVQPDGFIALDIVGNIKVVGMTLDKVHDEIVSLASSRLNHPELALTLKQFQQPYVVVAGEVAKPGKIEINESTTALQAILLAGGFSETAKDTKVYLYRNLNGGFADVRSLNLHDIKKDSQLERDAVLEPGDMILVTRNKLANFSRFMKSANLGVFLDPVPAVPF